jgi:hypothetical protein
MLGLFADDAYSLDFFRDLAADHSFTEPLNPDLACDAHFGCVRSALTTGRRCGINEMAFDGQPIRRLRHSPVLAQEGAESVR